MRGHVITKILPVAAAILASAIAACSPQGEHMTATGDELSSEFASQAVSTTPKSYEPALPPVDMPAMSSASASTTKP